MKLISVYALVKRERGKTTLTGGWRGDERLAPDDCIIKETRNGKVETHYWVVDGYDSEPKNKSKCLCGRARYKKEEQKK